MGSERWRQLLLRFPQDPSVAGCQRQQSAEDGQVPLLGWIGPAVSSVHGDDRAPNSLFPIVIDLSLLAAVHKQAEPDEDTHFRLLKAKHACAVALRTP